MGQSALEIMALYKSKTLALDMIAYHRDHHKPVYTSFAKNCYYDWAIQHAYEEVRRSNEPPLKVIDWLIAKFDAWAHTESDTATQFGCAVAAFDDLVDIIINS